MKGSAKKNRAKSQQLDAAAGPVTELRIVRGPAVRDYHDRRPLRFWQPFNDWWRGELERLGRRPSSQDIVAWYDMYAHEVWKEDAPSLQETRVHAKCLRSLPLVRDYFRSYRARKRNKEGRASMEDADMEVKDDIDYKDIDYDNLCKETPADYEDDGDGDCSPQPHYYHRHADHKDADADGGYPDEDTYDADGSGYGGRDAVVAAAASLAQLASLRGTGGPSAGSTAAAPAVGGLPPALTGFPSLSHPGLSAGQTAAILGGSPANLWAAAAAAQQAAAGGYDSVAAASAAAAGDTSGAGAQSRDLLRNITLQQLQHAAAVQQQLALAAIAQNLALSRVAGMGISALSAQVAAAASQQNALLAAVAAAVAAEGEEGRVGGTAAEEGYVAGDEGLDSRHHAGSAGPGPGGLNGKGADLAQRMQRAAAGKRKRVGAGAAVAAVARRQPHSEDDALEREPGLEAAAEEERQGLGGVDVQPGGLPGREAIDGAAVGAPSSRRGDGGWASQRQQQRQQSSGRYRRAGRGMVPAAGVDEGGGGVSAGAGDDDDEEVGAGLAHLLAPSQPLLQLSPIGDPRVEVMTRESLMGMSRQQLVDRVMVLQGQVQLLLAAATAAAQQQQQQQLLLQQSLLWGGASVGKDIMREDAKGGIMQLSPQLAQLQHQILQQQGLEKDREMNREWPRARGRQRTRRGPPPPAADTATGDDDKSPQRWGSGGGRSGRSSAAAGVRQDVPEPMVVGKDDAPADPQEAVGVLLNPQLQLLQHFAEAAPQADAGASAGLDAPPDVAQALLAVAMRVSEGDVSGGVGGDGSGAGGGGGNSFPTDPAASDGDSGLPDLMALHDVGAT